MVLGGHHTDLLVTPARDAGAEEYSSPPPDAEEANCVVADYLNQ